MIDYPDRSDPDRLDLSEMARGIRCSMGVHEPRLLDPKLCAQCGAAIAQNVPGSEQNRPARRHQHPSLTPPVEAGMRPVTDSRGPFPVESVPPDGTAGFVGGSRGGAAPTTPQVGVVGAIATSSVLGAMVWALIAHAIGGPAEPIIWRVLGVSLILITAACLWMFANAYDETQQR